MGLDYTNIPLKLEKEKFTYLGVVITRQYKNIYKENFVQCLNKTKQDITKWSPLSLSLVGRINSVKMTILPKFLYLFQCVPCFIPNSFFNSLESVISSYIWNNKKPRFCKAHLQRPRSRGGMSLPNFKFYYWAANIICLTLWLHSHLQPNSPTWTCLEANSFRDTSLPALLGAALPLLPGSTGNVVVRSSLRVWTQFRRNLGLQLPSLLCPIASNHFFPPSMQDATFLEWNKKGIRTFKDLFIYDCFASFSDLSKKFNLPSNNFFRYLQARHYVRFLIPYFPNLPAHNPIDKFLPLQPLARGSRSVIYNQISALKGTSLNNIKTAWEQDLDLSFSDDLWDAVLMHAHSTSMCARHSLLQFKVVR